MKNYGDWGMYSKFLILTKKYSSEGTVQKNPSGIALENPSIPQEKISKFSWGMFSQIDFQEEFFWGGVGFQ